MEFSWDQISQALGQAHTGIMKQRVRVTYLSRVEKTPKYLHVSRKAPPLQSVLEFYLLGQTKITC